MLIIILFDIHILEFWLHINLLIRIITYLFKIVINVFRSKVDSTNNTKNDVKKNQVDDKKQGKKSLKEKYVLLF